MNTFRFKPIALALLVMVGTLTLNCGYAQILLTELPKLKALKVNSTKVITSGLPTDEQFSDLQQAGVDLVIDLIPKNNPNANPNELHAATQAGLTYVNIEVDWKQPQIQDVEQFFEVMNTHKGKDILIHCAANYRASAFYYLYQITHERMDAEAAFKVTLTPWGNDIEQSLSEYPQWQALIHQIKEKYQIQ